MKRSQSGQISGLGGENFPRSDWRYLKIVSIFTVEETLKEGKVERVEKQDLCAGKIKRRAECFRPSIFLLSS